MSVAYQLFGNSNTRSVGAGGNSLKTTLFKLIMDHNTPNVKLDQSCNTILYSFQIPVDFCNSCDLLIRSYEELHNFEHVAFERSNVDKFFQIWSHSVFLGSLDLRVL